MSLKKLIFNNIQSLIDAPTKKKSSINFDAVNLLKEELIQWWEAAIKHLPNVILAIFILMITWVMSRLVQKWSVRILDKFSNNSAVTRLSGSVLSIMTLLIGLFIALEVMSLEKAVTSLLAGAGVLGIALGFAFQETSANFVSGFFIAFRKPYGIGDIVKTNDIFGVVKAINLRSTIIRSFDGLHAIVPNKYLFTDPLWNFTRDHNRRVDLAVGVSYSDDLEHVEKVALNAIDNIEGRDKTKDTEFYYTDFGDSSINFEARFWIKFPNLVSYLKARHSAIKNIKAAFDKEGISIPFPIRTLDMSEGILEKIAQSSSGTKVDSKNKEKNNA